MGTSPYQLVGNTPFRAQVGSASDNTRSIRLAAQVAPYLAGINSAPRLGWKSPALSAEARLAVTIFGSIKSSFPSR